jgi:hypothetical protein
MPRKPLTSTTTGKKKKAPSPIDAKQKKIEEQEAKLRAEISQCERVIKEAPVKAEQLKRIQREQAAARNAHIEGRFGPKGSLAGHRLELNAGMPAKHLRLRAERNRGRFLFFILLIVFCAAVFFLWITVTHNAGWGDVLPR